MQAEQKHSQVTRISLHLKQNLFPQNQTTYASFAGYIPINSHQLLSIKEVAKRAFSLHFPGCGIKDTEGGGRMSTSPTAHGGRTSGNFCTTCSSPSCAQVENACLPFVQEILVYTQQIHQCVCVCVFT